MNSAQHTIPEEISQLVENLKNPEAFDREERLGFLEELEKTGQRTSQLFILDALIERAKDDPDPYLKRQAWEASKKIWDVVWKSRPISDDGGQDDDPQGRRAVFSKFLVALKEDDDRGDWEVRRAAADWLRENYDDLSKDKMMIIGALQALLEQADKERDPNVLRSAVEASKTLWGAGWAVGPKQPFLYQILKALKTENWQIRQAAADWLGEKADDIAADNLYLVDALSALLERTGDENDQVLRSAVEASKKIWNAAWKVNPQQQAAVLRRVLDALQKEAGESEQDPWQIRQAAAEWLREKADDIAGNNLYLVDALSALARRAYDDDEDVFYSALAARTKIWDRGWENAEHQTVILRWVLDALQEADGRAQRLWEIRETAADWLRSHSHQLAKGDGYLVKALSALAKRADDDDEDVRMAAIQAITAIWPDGRADGKREAGRIRAIQAFTGGRAGKVTDSDPQPEMVGADWQVKLAKFLDTAASRAEADLALDLLDKTVWPTHRSAVVGRVLETLKKGADDPDEVSSPIRQAAANWLGEKADEIAEESYETYTKVAGALNHSRQNDPSPELRSSAWTALNSLWDALHRLQFPKYRKMIRAQADADAEIEEDDDAQIRAIRHLVNPISLGSRQAMAFLVEEWVDWIGANRHPRLVGLTAEAMRLNRYAILPLVEHFVKVAEQDGGGRQPDAPLKTMLALSRPEPNPEYLRMEAEAGAERRLNVRRRISRQLADMSDPRFFEENPELRESNIYQLCRHAVPVLVRRMPVEEDLETLENLARTLGHTRDQEAIDALAQAVVGEEREHNARKKLLAKYYLDPSKERSQQAAEILREAISESRRTLRILRALNIAVFVVGLAVLLFGLVTILISEDGASLAVGGLAAVGGLGGVLVQLVRDPLNRIQNAMSNLVQMETAFTSFIWELNLNGTFIQSHYIAKGKLGDEQIGQTVGRIENAMELTMDLVATYADEGGQRLVTRIHKLDPVEGPAGTKIGVYGQHLRGDGRDKKERTGMVAIDHVPMRADKDDLTWDAERIEFTLPSELTDESIWISLIVDGMETNALPFHIVNQSNTQ